MKKVFSDFLGTKGYSSHLSVFPPLCPSILPSISFP